MSRAPVTRVTAGEVVGFWREAGYRQWFGGGATFDRECETRFLDAHWKPGWPMPKARWRC